MEKIESVALIVLITLIAICGIILILLSIFMVLDIVDKYKNHITELAIDKCTDCLLEYCKSKDIPVVFESKILNDSTAGLIKYTKETIPSNGKLIAYKNFVIHIKQSRNNRFVYITLAHEIGHYISLINYDDGSESGADYEAKKLVESFLTKKELRVMKSELDVFFEHDLVIHTKSLQYRYISESQEYLYLIV